MPTSRGIETALDEVAHADDERSVLVGMGLHTRGTVKSSYWTGSKADLRYHTNLSAYSTSFRL